jgi:muramidase (phage lysozyme)
MNSLDKLALSAHIIKKAYAGYFPPAQQPASKVQPVPKAIPISVATPVPKAIPISAAKVAPPPSKVTAQPMMSPYQPILDVIRKGESNVAGYDTMVGSNKPFGLTNKTLQQVLDLQKQRLKTHGGTAAGGYQILNKNLLNLAKQHKHDLNKTLFDQATQDTYAKSLMDRRGFKDYLAGKITPDQMRINLAKEWAALPAKGEQSYYHGVGNNAARIKAKEINDAIQKSLELHSKSLQ